MSLGFSLLALAVLILIPSLGMNFPAAELIFGIIIPYLAAIAFLAGFVYRILTWAKSPVPFRIPTTCGQEKTLPWIREARLDNPSSRLGVIGRMTLEILFFRSLFRNTKTELVEGPRVVYGSSKYLWAAGLAFHYTLLIILIRHFRYFFEPVPAAITILQDLDGFFQVGVPIIYATNIIILAALGFLTFRRIFDAKLRYISSASDWFPLLLIAAIATTGILMRYLLKVDIVGIKQLTMGLLTLNPVLPEGISPLFFVHLFLVSALLIYFPSSKLMHMGGVFLSPTRNLANNNRAKTHINPWNYDVKVHTYEEYEDEFRALMKGAGLPLEKEPAEKE